MTAATQIEHKPTLGRSPYRLVLHRNRAVENAELPRVISETFGELYARIAQSGIAPAGPPFVIYNNKPEPGGKWEIDICAPVSAPVSAQPDFEFTAMPAGRIVSLLHVGPYEKLGDAYEAARQFIDTNGLMPAGPPRELYLSEPDVPPEEVQTLIEWPIA